MDPGRTDEAAIERDLVAVIERFRGEPRAALGIRPDADVAAVRAAFMALCKRYHPAKFARRPPATLRLANEAFLAIRRAYDELLRLLAPKPAPARPSAAASKTEPGFGPPRHGAPLAVTRTEPSPSSARTDANTPRTDANTPRARTGPSPAPARSDASPATRSDASPSAARTEPSPPARIDPRVRIEPSPPPARTDASPSPTRSEPSPPARIDPRARIEPSPPTSRPEPSPPAVADTGPRSNFDRALELLRDRRWADARPLLVEAATAAPGDVRYRAYLHYVRGWESFELGKPGEARAEWQRALACDPGLGMAQWALGKTGLG